MSDVVTENWTKIKSGTDKSQNQSKKLLFW